MTITFQKAVRPPFGVRQWCAKPTHLEPVTQIENNRRIALRNRGVAF